MSINDEETRIDDESIISYQDKVTEKNPLGTLMVGAAGFFSVVFVIFSALSFYYSSYIDSNDVIVKSGKIRISNTKKNEPKTVSEVEDDPPDPPRKTVPRSPPRPARAAASRPARPGAVATSLRPPPGRPRKPRRTAPSRPRHRLTGGYIREGLEDNLGLAELCTNTQIRWTGWGAGVTVDHCPGYRTLKDQYVELTLSPNGDVLGVRFDEKKAAKTDLGSCLDRSINTWVFPQFPGTRSSRMRVKMRFEPCVPIDGICVF